VLFVDDDSGDGTPDAAQGVSYAEGHAAFSDDVVKALDLYRK
jgi:hypothetical protein